MVSLLPPVWVRGLLRLDRALTLAMRVESMLRDELVLGLVPAAERDRLTRWVFSRQATYLPGGVTFEGGLFDWERAALAASPFPPRGRYLIGAAGAGREAVELVRRGCDVVAFEPCAPFVEAARALSELEKQQILCASYADLKPALTGEGPLAAAFSGAPFDAVILGWASLSHVVEARDRLELLSALRVLAPRAPVLASFFLRSAESTVGQVARMRRGTRRALALLGAPSAAREGLRFLPWAGFTHLFDEGELDALADEAGYAVERFAATPYAHAVLVPR